MKMKLIMYIEKAIATNLRVGVIKAIKL